MTLVEVAGGFVAGVIAGIGVSIFYIRWKVKRQLGMMQGQMEEMMDMTAGMDGMAQEMADLEDELPEDLEDEVPEDLEDGTPDSEEKQD